MITVQIDNRLRVRKSDLPIGHEAAIKQRLTVANGEKAAAAKRRQWGWEHLPDAFALYEDDGPYLIMPRGFALELRAGLEMSGVKIAWDDQTSAPSMSLMELIGGGPTLRPDQEKACNALLQHRQGVIQAPTGAGKTVLVLEAWRRTGLKGLILVEKAGLAKQWREHAMEHLGVEVGLIGEGEWDEKHLTVAMMQTLRSREIGDAWFRRWGFTAADECHHLRGNSYSHIAKRICSRYLIGVTATPLEGMWEQPFLTHTLGPIVHITSDETLRCTGQRVTPLVRRVHTGWRWQPANAREEQLVDTKAIYRHVIKALERDPERVRRIAKKIIAQPDTCSQLVLAKKLDYLDQIEDALEDAGYAGEIYKMRGSVEADRRTEIANLADAGGCVILATSGVAGEGMNIKRLDRLHLVWPQRQELELTQQIGRVLRSHPDKQETVIYDYVDEEGMLANQARLRAIVYRKAGYFVEEERDMMQRSFT